MIRIERVLVLFLAACAASSAPGQDSSRVGTAAPPTVGASRSEMNYANEPLPENVLFVDMSYMTAADSNPVGMASGSDADLVQSSNAHLLVMHQTDRFGAFLEYTAYYQFFRHYREYDAFNQNASADVLRVLTSRWSVRLRDDYAKQTGLYSSLNSSSGGTTGGLNETILSPLQDVRQNEGRGDVTYQPSVRTTMDLFLVTTGRQFSSPSSSPYNTRALSGGGEYHWNSAPHATIGFQGWYQGMVVSGDLPDVLASRLKVLTATTTFDWAPRPMLEIKTFAGPQDVTLEAASNNAAYSDSHSWEWTAGASISKRTEDAAVILSGLHEVTDGGGLSSFVVTSQLNAEYRRRLRRGWDMNVRAGFARNRSLPLAGPASRLQEQDIAAGFTHQITTAVAWQVQYQFMQQSGADGTPGNPEFTRHRISAGINWKVSAMRLGRQ